MSVHKLDAARRTLKLFDDAPLEPIIEAEERTAREHSDGINIDDIAFRWAAEGDIQKDAREDSYFVRVAKFKNGYRGLQFVRFKGDNPRDPKSVSYQSCVTLTPEQYYEIGRAHV